MIPFDHFTLIFCPWNSVSWKDKHFSKIDPSARMSLQIDGKTVRLWPSSSWRQDEHEGCSHPCGSGLRVRSLWSFGCLWHVCFVLFCPSVIVSKLSKTIAAAAASKSVLSQTESPKKHAAVQAIGCRQCLSLVLVPEDSAQDICMWVASECSALLWQSLRKKWIV